MMGGKLRFILFPFAIFYTGSEFRRHFMFRLLECLYMTG